MRIFLSFILIVVLLSSCGGGGRPSTPKPEAYPRIEVPDSVFRTVRVMDTEMTVNSEALADIEERGAGEGWLTVTYPTLDSIRVYLTVSHAAAPEDVEGILFNRRERMSLNLGGANGVATTLTSAGGWECEMVTSRSALSTPVQILARKGGKVVSGTLYLQLPPDTSADSVVPVIDVVERDMLTLLKTL